MAKIFDLESLVDGLCAYYCENDKLKIDPQERRLWEVRGDVEFSEFFTSVCQLPHVIKLLEDSPELDLLPHSSTIVYRKLKRTLRAMVWQYLGDCSERMFLKENNKPVVEFTDYQLLRMQCIEKASLDKWFSLHFTSGSTVMAGLDEEFIPSMFYTNEEIVKSLGQEMCIALDVGVKQSSRVSTVLLVPTR